MHGWDPSAPAGLEADRSRTWSSNLGGGAVCALACRKTRSIKRVSKKREGSRGKEKNPNFGGKGGFGRP